MGQLSVSFYRHFISRKKKSINQPSNDCKKEWIFLSFCQFFFQTKKKAVLGTTNDTTKRVKSLHSPGSSVFLHEKKIVKVSALGAASKQGSTRAAELLAYG